MAAPNILLISTDQHRYDALGCAGRPVETPVVDRLAADGVLFERCYTPSPVCSPGRASLLTGVYPHVHGLWANGVALPPGRRLLGRRLSDAGYDCGLAGRYHLSACAEGRTEPRHHDGFRFFEWADSPGHPSPENRYHHWLAETFPDLWREHGTDAHDMPVEAHFSRWVSEQTIRFIQEERDPDTPFFFVANFFDPHHPFTAPSEYLDRYRGRDLPHPIRPPFHDDDKPPLQAAISNLPETGIEDIIAAYYAMVSLVDNEVGRILEALDASGESSDTIVIFTSDHGEMLGDHAQLLKGPLFYEGAVRVPLVVRWPRRLPAGVRSRELVQTFDVFATCIAAAGVPAPQGMQARDLVPLAGEESSRGRGWALCEYRDSAYPLHPPVHATMLRTDRHKLVAYHGGGGVGELYDLEGDPDELTNRWNDHAYADVRRDMTELLLDVLVETEDRSAIREARW